MEHSESREPQRVRRMFDTVARRYDLLNRLLSLNLDRRWRRQAAAELASEPLARVLDLCGGTGDLTVELARSGCARTVICCDFSHAMLERARPKLRRERVSASCMLLEADGLRLPFPDEVFDAVTVAFGVRNLADSANGFREIHRVLQPGGRMVVLEFSTPPGPILRRLYGVYLTRVLPRVGDGVSGRVGAYRYLARTISGFPDPATLAGRIREGGFAGCGWRRLSGGIVAIHTAFRSGSDLRPDLSRRTRGRRGERGAAPSERGAGSPPAGR
jgi:demethylmenaquinone methyltransferase/2-methoxy-6-polyprenyl-1,4-benzoquinol methylase